MGTLRSIVNWLSKHRWFSLFLGALLVAAVYGIRFVSIRAEGVTSGPLKRGPIVEAVYGIGTVQATKSFALKPGIISHINRLYVKEGDAVRVGEKLVELDRLFTSPLNGVVNYLPFKEGENVPPSSPVLVVTDLSNRYMLVNLQQQGAVRVKAGQTARISFDMLRDRTFEGLVESVYSYNGDFFARIRISGLPKEILPEMTADVAIVIREIPDALVIPAAAYEDGFVWVRRDRGLPAKVPVQIGVVDEAKLQVIGGDLAEGDQVMIRRKMAP